MLPSTRTTNGDVVQQPPNVSDLPTFETVIFEFAEESYLMGVVTNFNDEVRLIIGDQYSNGRHFDVQRSMLCAHSALLRRIFRRPFRPRQTVVRGDPELFSVYYDWLHTGQLFMRWRAFGVMAIEPRDEGMNANERLKYVRLARLYLLSYRLEDMKFGNTVIEGFFAAIDGADSRLNRSSLDPRMTIPNLPGPRCINMIFNNILVPNRLKYLLVEAYTDSKARRRCFDEWSMDKFHSDFLCDLNVQLLRTRPAESNVGEGFEDSNLYPTQVSSPA